jgi:hypothetical protein
MKSLGKAGFPQGRAFTEEYNSLWPLKCGADLEFLGTDSEFLDRGKDFDHHVEAHESTCKPWTAS